MTKSDFSFTLLVDQTPEEVFNAVNNVRGWWTENLRGSSRHIGDEFEVRFADLHYSTQKVVELIPNTTVVWQVTDSYLSFLQNPREWTNTSIRFDITKVGAETQLQFTHLGLVPEVECFGACSGGWNQYAKNSLWSLITTGKGQPEPQESVSDEATETSQGNIAGKIVLVTGANRGIGRALVEEALQRGAKRVYAGTPCRPHWRKAGAAGP